MQQKVEIGTLCAHIVTGVSGFRSIIRRAVSQLSRTVRLLLSTHSSDRS